MDVSLSGNMTALIVCDVATGWLDACPAGSKRTEETVSALQQFASPAQKVWIVETHDALEYQGACKIFGYRPRTSMPGRPQTSGNSERSVREAPEGAHTLMRQAGALHRCWSRVLRHYCFLHNASKPPVGGRSPWELRFGERFAGPVLAFGSEVSYKSAVNDPSGPGNTFGTSSKQHTLVGYFMSHGGA